MDHMHVFSLMFFTFTLIFSAYSVIKDPLWALPVEVLNGIVFGLVYSAAISYAAHVTPAGAEGTLQGFVGTALNGIGTRVIWFENNAKRVGFYICDQKIETCKLFVFQERP